MDPLEQESQLDAAKLKTKKKKRKNLIISLIAFAIYILIGLIMSGESKGENLGALIMMSPLFLILFAFVHLIARSFDK